MFKKLLLCIVVLALFTSILWADNLKLGTNEVLLEPSSKPVIVRTLNGDLSNPFGRVLDTLYYDDGTGVWGYQGTSNALWYAVRFTPPQPCTVKAELFKIWRISGANQICTLFVWNDAAGTPTLPMDGPVVVTAQAHPTWSRGDFTGNYTDSDDFWLGIWLPWWSPGDSSRILADNPCNYPTRQAIGLRTGPTSWNWTVSPGLKGDLMIRAIVALAGQAPDIECSPNPLVVDLSSRDILANFYCKNVGSAQLDVTNILKSAAWIDSIYPTVFSVPAAGSIQVTVDIDTTQVLRDIYEDTLWVESNDPDENPYGEVVILIVPGIEEEPVISETPATPSVKCHPNPTRNTTSIRFTLSDMADISIDVHDVSGRRVTTLANGEYESGVHNISWNRKDEKGVRVPQGIYFIRLKSEGIKANAKLIVID